ncbi:MAG: proline--tRNA ligase [Patescibacteria group bacterium]|nr:proline--tRNA ligase [Patescibacteria group bacterium]
MRYSKMFAKTIREAPKDYKLKSHRLLYQAGMVQESTAGRYYFLPLGMRVHDKIAKIIEEEMDQAGGQKMVTPVLHPLELWQETNRTASTGFELMKVKDRRGAEFALGGTAEEMMVELVRRFKLSYKDLPFNIYQFSTKFRDELRARGGLLRVREFTMKDAYSFHADETDFKKEYRNMAKTYTRIFERLGLKTIQVAADNGYIGGEYCHEFVVESPIGESRYFTAGDYCAHEEVACFKREMMNEKEKVKEFKIIKQPKWVQTMADNIKHYGEPLWRYLKNVVYKNRTTGEIIIAGIRGDLEVNKVKLEHLLGVVGQLDEAEEKDLAKLGTKTGYVHSWGHKGAKYVADLSLKTAVNFIGGQKEEETDSFNVNYGRDFKTEVEGDIAMVQAGFLAENGEKLVEKRGIEVGNIFQLGYHYSNLMKGAEFVDKNGQLKKYYMGCYGIGLGRTMATIVEKFNDDKGIIWPSSVTPYTVHLINLQTDGEKIYQKLLAAGVEVLWDDRENVSAGVKFADADLIGIPVRLVVSEKTKDKIEWKQRDKKEAELLKLDEVIKRCQLKS